MEKNNNLLILGAGELGHIAKEIAEAMGVFGKIDFLDDESELAIGKLNEYEELVVEYNYGFVAIGNPEIRMKWIEKLQADCYQIAILVSPKAYIAPSATLMKGTLVEANATVNTLATVAVGSIISAGAVVNHNSFVGDGCHIDCNGVVEARSIVPAMVKVNSCTVFNREDSEQLIKKMGGVN